MSDVTLKRIMDLETQSEVDNSVYTIIDSPTGYGKKFPLGSFIASVAPIFDSTAAYTAGSYCNYNGQIYRFTADHAAGSWTGSDVTAVNVGGELSDLKQEINQLFGNEQLLNTTKINWKNNTAVTNNNDGSYTIGTTDYGLIVFGDVITLIPGIYLLYGVPSGSSYIFPSSVTGSQSYNNAIVTNSSSGAKLFEIESQISILVGHKVPSTPSSSYTIYPTLYRLVPTVETLYSDLLTIDEQLLNQTKLNWKNNTAITNNDDGSYDVGTSDYGLAVFGDAITLTKGYYQLYGAQSGDAYIYPSSFTGSQSFTNAIVKNSGQNPKRFYIEDSVEVLVGLRVQSAPASAYTVYPSLYSLATITDTVETSEKLYGKTIVCDGDSISAGYKDEPDNLGAWYGRLHQKYNTKGRNYSASGATITDMRPTVSHSVAVTIDTIHTDFPTLDYLILEGGTNDADRIGAFVDDTPPSGFGTWSDENLSDYNGTYDDETFCGAVETLFYKAVTYYPNTKIGFIIPMQMGTTMYGSKNRRRYFDEIKKIAKKWHINVLDIWDICHADARLSAYYSGTEGDLTKFYYDGQHPTSVGYNLMQPIIEEWMKSL